MTGEDSGGLVTRLVNDRSVNSSASESTSKPGWTWRSEGRTTPRADGMHGANRDSLMTSPNRTVGISVSQSEREILKFCSISRCKAKSDLDGRRVLCFDYATRSLPLVLARCERICIRIVASSSPTTLDRRRVGQAVRDRLK